ncbi:E3 ubiquitin-protein ligase MARCHF5-like isoform X2 [Carettochelys insculpta]|uniref:E3 ubiquitin-protein ligase MARCHF5-like isoform X2 n=1 Tax=Carettochelys insculpta TaxID=44489 RepID=UPI003EBF8162
MAEERHCWLCFCTEQEDRAAEWICPCRCKGSTKWAHQGCLQRWLDEKQKGNSTSRVSCPQCGTAYHVAFPTLGPLVYFLHKVDRALSRASPFAMAGIVVGTVYWSAVTYGAITVMQVVGHKKGLGVMERADPLFLLLGLPTIPVLLVLGRLVRWEEYVLHLWQKYSSKLQALVPGISCPVPPGPLAESCPPSDPPSLSRMLCGALVFPSVASLVGRLLFRRTGSSLQRTILLQHGPRDVGLLLDSHQELC